MSFILNQYEIVEVKRLHIHVYMNGGIRATTKCGVNIDSYISGRGVYVLLLTRPSTDGKTVSFVERLSGIQGSLAHEEYEKLKAMIK